MLANVCGRELWRWLVKGWRITQKNAWVKQVSSWTTPRAYLKQLPTPFRRKHAWHLALVFCPQSWLKVCLKRCKKCWRTLYAPQRMKVVLKKWYWSKQFGQRSKTTRSCGCFETQCPTFAEKDCQQLERTTSTVLAPCQHYVNAVLTVSPSCVEQICLSQDRQCLSEPVCHHITGVLRPSFINENWPDMHSVWCLRLDAVCLAGQLLFLL